MGKHRPKPRHDRPEPVDTQELAEDLYERGLITRHQAFGDRPWIPTRRPYTPPVEVWPW